MIEMAQNQTFEKWRRGRLLSVTGEAHEAWHAGAASRDAEVADLQRELAVSQEVSDRHLKDAGILQARIDRVKALEIEFRKSSLFYSGLETEEENTTRQAAYERCADELLRALEGK
jgi:hypothetical protein